MTRATESELDILNVLWERGPLTVRQVHEALADTRDVGYTTILKQMQTMHEKGLLDRDESGRSHIYRATMQRQDWLGGVMDRFFGGSLRNLVMGALAGGKPSSEELEEVRRLLEKHGSEKPEKKKKKA